VRRVDEREASIDAQFREGIGINRVATPFSSFQEVIWSGRFMGY
jgi:hypothetical protein